MNRKSLPIPEPIVQLQRQLEQFRSIHLQRTKLPEALWLSAIELARLHGVYAVAHPLRLDYTRLKQRLGGDPVRRQNSPKPAFLELISPTTAPPEECVVEFESPTGSKMRIHWKTTTVPDWSGLLRAWRDAER